MCVWSVRGRVCVVGAGSRERTSAPMRTKKGPARFLATKFMRAHAPFQPTPNLSKKIRGFLGLAHSSFFPPFRHWLNTPASATPR